MQITTSDTSNDQSKLGVFAGLGSNPLSTSLNAASHPAEISMAAYNLDAGNTLKENLEIWLTDPRTGNKLKQAKFMRVFDNNLSAELITLTRETGDNINVRTQRIRFDSNQALVEHRDMTEYLDIDRDRLSERRCWVCKKETEGWQVRQYVPWDDDFGGKSSTGQNSPFIFGPDEPLQRNFEPAPKGWDFHNMLSLPLRNSSEYIFSTATQSDYVSSLRSLGNQIQNSQELKLFLEDARFYLPKEYEIKSKVSNLAVRIRKWFSNAYSPEKWPNKKDDFSNSLLAEGQIVLNHVLSKYFAPLLWPQVVCKWNDGSIRPDPAYKKEIQKAVYLTTDKDGKFYLRCFNFYPNGEFVSCWKKELKLENRSAITNKDFNASEFDNYSDPSMWAENINFRSWYLSRYIRAEALKHLLEQGHHINLTPQDVLKRQPDEWIGLAHQLHSSGKFVPKPISEFNLPSIQR